MSDKLVPFSWYGGKCSHLNWLLPIVNGVPHQLYVESFGGSGSVLLNKKPSPVEVYNDTYSDVVNFFKVLRNQRDELIALLELTPYSREEFADACNTKSESDIERARKFFVIARQVRTGMATLATPGKWAYVKKDSRRQVALTVSRWLGSIEMLEDIAMRLKEVQIENLDALDIIKRYDMADCLHFIDPPYCMNTRNGIAYAHEFDDRKHEQLLDLLTTLKGKVCLCGYWNEMYVNRLANWHIKKVSKIAPSTIKGETPDVREECLWTNFSVGGT